MDKLNTRAFECSRHFIFDNSNHEHIAVGNDAARGRLLVRLPWLHEGAGVGCRGSSRHATTRMQRWTLVCHGGGRGDVGCGVELLRCSEV